jgi:pyruvate dehydrogenase E2 component (dihydrolipoamide acetyltransferase)
MIEIKMPRLSDTMEEGAIATWHKKPGDHVEVGDVLVEIETDKATMDYEAYEAGTLTEILVGEGSTVAIGTPIATLDNGRNAPASPAASAAPAATPTAAAAPDAAPTPAPAPPASSVVESPHAPVVAAAHAGEQGYFASPLVRRLAREHGLDLSSLRGSGPGGRIIRADLDGLLGGVTVPAAPSRSAHRAPVATGPIVDATRETQEVPLTNARRVIARRLSQSAQSIPHFYVTAVADVELLLEMRADLNAQAAESGGSKISVNDLVVKAVAMTLREHPDVNASYLGDDAKVMHLHNRVNVGVAVASRHGLVVPVIMDADLKSVAEIGAQAKALATQANGKGLSIEQMSGGTFTVSNLGMFGVEEFTAIINPPEGAILAVGATQREAVVQGDAIVARQRMRLTLSADHRIIDGALAAQFLRSLVGVLEHPWRIVASVD